MIYDYLKRINIICGHYGAGKTNLALNLALGLASSGKPVTLVDMDIINPYFRSGDYKTQLQAAGVRVIAPNFVATNVDVPSLPAEIASVFTDKTATVIIDLGGDDAGAFALGRYREQILADDYALFYVCNFFRSLTPKVQEAAELFEEINTVLQLQPTAVINNSHLQHLTTTEVLQQGYKKSVELSSLLKLPLAATAVEKQTAKKIAENEDPSAIKNIYPVEIYVKAF
ncbi:MAG: ParA family protein [Oscillospiraceae bacterium]|jgi:hypothetical protein|nr:ParA family protein [Oscillospiraceae bacterium]